MLRTYIKRDCLPLWYLAIPLVLTGLSQSSTYFFENLFLARLGPDALAAGSLVGWLFGTLAVISFGILGAISVSVSHRHGAGDRVGVAQVAQAGVLLALFLALCSFGLLWNSPLIVRLLGQSETIVALSESYFHALAWGMVPNFIVGGLLDLIVGLGHGRTVLVLNILSVLMTIGFSFVLIFGKFGFPALGIAGAGWGIAISSALMAVILLVFMCAHGGYRRYFSPLRLFKSDCAPIALFAELLKLGLPIGVMFSLEVTFFLVLTLVVGALFGPHWTAANQVALQYMCFLMSLVFSIAQSVTVRMGHLLGAEDPLGAERAAWCGVATSSGVMFLLGFVFWTRPDVLIAIDFGSELTKVSVLLPMMLALFKVTPIFQIVESARITLFGALRGLKDTRFPLVSSMVGFWLIPCLIGYGLIQLTSLGPVGLWWGMSFGALVSAAMLAWRFRVKMRVMNHFREQEVML